jgi:hypothetical protein
MTRSIRRAVSDPFLASAPSAVVNGPRNEEGIWWKGTDNQLYEEYWNGQWNGPIRVGMGPLG